jgi:hypothetical protein
MNIMNIFVKLQDFILPYRWKYETGTKHQSRKFCNRVAVYTQFRLLHTASLSVTLIHLLQADPLLVLYVKCVLTWTESSFHSPKHKILRTIIDHCERNTQGEILTLWNEVLARAKIHVVCLLCFQLLSLGHVLTYRWEKWLHIQYMCKYTSSISSKRR